MKLRNKKTGEVVKLREDEEIIIPIEDNDGDWYEECYNSIAELNEDWEDCEEPKDFYYIQADGDIHLVQYKTPEYQLKKFKTIGNYFETKEEAEKAVEKLKAWKRLNDARIEFLESENDRRRNS